MTFFPDFFFQTPVFATVVLVTATSVGLVISASATWIPLRVLTLATMLLTPKNHVMETESVNVERACVVQPLVVER